MGMTFSVCMNWSFCIAEELPKQVGGAWSNSFYTQDGVFAPSSILCMQCHNLPLNICSLKGALEVLLELFICPRNLRNASKFHHKNRTGSKQKKGRSRGHLKSLKRAMALLKMRFLQS